MTHRFYAMPESFRDDRVLLDLGETRHLRDVLRLDVGSNVNVFDGCGREFCCTVAEIRKSETELLVISEQPASSPESAVKMTLAAAMLKGEKFDLVVQKAVELGVRRVIALSTIRCDVKIKESTKRIERWRKIALEASKQSGRAQLMEVSGPLEFDAFLGSITDGSTAFMFAERDGDRLPAELSVDEMTAIVGPEGGWDDAELAAARDRGVRVVTFGGRIMRAETAAIAITSILQNRFGDIN